METNHVLEHLLKAAQWTASRSSGPGGQHRDKASTRAELTLSLDSLVGLEPGIAGKLAAALDLDDQPLRIVVQDERSLSRNQELAIERLRGLVVDALRTRLQRRPTRPSRASRERRLADKTRRARDKVLRREARPDAD